jgi:hypothetical protein
MFSDILNSTALFVGMAAWTACPSDRGGIKKKKKSVWSIGIMALTGECGALGEEI